MLHLSTTLLASFLPSFLPSRHAYLTCVPSSTGSSQWDYLSTGRGLLTFNLTNLRADIAFYYFSNGLRNPSMRCCAGIDMICCSRYLLPIYHLSITHLSPIYHPSITHAIDDAMSRSKSNQTVSFRNPNQPLRARVVATGRFLTYPHHLSSSPITILIIIIYPHHHPHHLSILIIYLYPHHHLSSSPISILIR